MGPAELVVAFGDLLWKDATLPAWKRDGSRAMRRWLQHCWPAEDGALLKKKRGANASQVWFLSKTNNFTGWGY